MSARNGELKKMAETLLSLSTVLLYGRKLDDLVLVPKPAGGTKPVGDYDISAPMRIGANNFLQVKLTATGARRPKLLELPEFSALATRGTITILPKPALFVVHGKGAPVEGPAPSGEFAEQRFSRAPGSVDRTGVSNQYGSFASDIKVWSYDKSDLSIRLDAMSGSFEQILLESEMSGDRLKTQIGAAAMMRMRAGRAED